MKLLNKLWIRFTGGKLIIRDEFGNEYYESNSVNYLGKKIRSVIYKNEAEPSKVPPCFHAWLHHLTDELPDQKQINFNWQRVHEPNMTGTNLSYSPLEKGKRAKVSSDYHPWQPN